MPMPAKYLLDTTESEIDAIWDRLTPEQRLRAMRCLSYAEPTLVDMLLQEVRSCLAQI